MKDKITALAFIGLISGLGLLGVFLPDRVFSPEENRYLAGKPKVSWEALASGKLGADYDKYLSDQFPGRNGWVRLHAGTERTLGKKDINGVYFGKDGYFLEKYDTEDIETSLFEKNLKAVTDFTAKTAETLGADHVRLMLVPSSSEILTDKLPSFASPYQQEKAVRKAEKMMKEKQPEKGEETVVPVLEKLQAHKEEEIYYKTDHHWTALGAYYGYEAWAESVGIMSWKKEDFQVQTVTEDFLGTIASKVNLSSKYSEKMEVYLPEKHMEYEVFYDGSEKENSQLYSWDYLNKKDKYSIYLDGNHGLTRIENKAVGQEKGKKLLVIKDSFAHSAAPFLINHFETVFMIDLRYFNLPVSRFLVENDITDVLVLYQIPGFAGEKTAAKIGW